MKSLLFILIAVLGIQSGFSQYPKNKILKDTIIFNNHFFKQLHEKSLAFENTSIKQLQISDRVFKLDSTQLFKTGYYTIKTNIVFCNKTEEIIFIRNIKGGSNHFADHQYENILPNEQKSIIMTLGFRKIIGNKRSALYSFVLNRPEEKEIKIFRKHIFDFNSN